MKEFILEYWVQVAFGVITGATAALYKRLSGRIKKENSERRQLREGVLAILHDRLYQCCRYSIAKGYIGIEDMRNIEYMYRSYHGLGGNGTGTELYQRVTKLPIKED